MAFYILVVFFAAICSIRLIIKFVNSIKYIKSNMPLAKKATASPISVIIPVSNSEKYIKKTIDSILDSNVKGIIIITVDDGSTDKSTEILKEYETRGLIRNLRIQKGGKLNAIKKGLEAVTTDIIILTDDDIIFKEDTVNFLINALAHTDIDVAAGLVLPFIKKEWKNPIVLAQFYEYVLNFFERRFSYSKGKRSLFSGQLVAFRRQILRNNLPKSANSLCEDFETGLNLIFSKAKAIAVKEAVAFHAKIPKTIRNFIKQRIRWHGGLMREALDNFFPFSFEKFRVFVDIIFYPFLITFFSLILLICSFLSGKYFYFIVWAVFLVFMRIVYDIFLIPFVVDKKYNQRVLLGISSDIIITPLISLIAFVAQLSQLCGIRISWDNTRIENLTL